MSENRIIGFLNRGRFYPMYVIVIYVSDHQVYARYPSGETCQIKNSEEDVLSRDNLIPVKEKTVLSDEDIAFAVSEEEIYVEPTEKILEKIQTLLNCGRFEDNVDAKKILEQLLSTK